MDGEIKIKVALDQGTLNQESRKLDKTFSKKRKVRIKAEDVKVNVEPVISKKLQMAAEMPSVQSTPSTVAENPQVVNITADEVNITASIVNLYASEINDKRGGEGDNDDDRDDDRKHKEGVSLWRGMVNRLEDVGAILSIVEILQNLAANRREKFETSVVGKLTTGYLEQVGSNLSQGLTSTNLFQDSTSFVNRRVRGLDSIYTATKGFVKDKTKEFVDPRADVISNEIKDQFKGLGVEFSKESGIKGLSENIQILAREIMKTGSTQDLQDRFQNVPDDAFVNVQKKAAEQFSKETVKEATEGISKTESGEVRDTPMQRVLSLQELMSGQKNSRGEKLETAEISIKQKLREMYGGLEDTVTKSLPEAAKKKRPETLEDVKSLINERLTKKEVLEPFARSLGIKNPSKVKKADLINLIGEKVPNPQQLKQSLPFMQPVSEDVTKEVKASLGKTREELQSRVTQFIADINERITLPTTGEQLFDISNELEREYEFVKQMVGEALDEDVVKYLTGAKLSIAKLRKKTSRVFTKEISDRRLKEKSQSSLGQTQGLGQADLGSGQNLARLRKSDIREQTEQLRIRARIKQLVLRDKLEELNIPERVKELNIPERVKQFNLPGKIKDTGILDIPNLPDVSGLKIRERLETNLPRIRARLNGVKRSGMKLKAPDPKMLEKFNQRVQEQAQARLQENFEIIFRETIKAQGLNPSDFTIPTIKTDQEGLDYIEADAMADVVNNQIVISKNIQKALEGSRSNLSRAKETLAILAHESQHIIQTRNGEIPVYSDKQFASNVSINPDAYDKAKSQVETIKRINPDLSEQQEARLFRAEAEAYSAETFTPNISKKLKGMDDQSVEAKSVKYLTETFNSLGDSFEHLTGIDVGGYFNNIFARLKQGQQSVKQTQSNFTSLMSNLASGVFSFAGLTAAIIAVGTVVPHINEAAMSMETFTNQIRAVSSGSSELNQRLKFVSDTAENLGIDVRGAYDSYADLLGATRDTSLEGAPTEQIFRAVSQAAAVKGLSSQQQERAFVAITQIADKGTVSSEEIKGQLSEAVSGSGGIAARAQGVSRETFNKQLATGSIASEPFLIKFSQQLEGETALGLAKNVDSTTRSINQFNNAVFKTQVATADSLGLLPIKRFFLDIGAGIINTVADQLGFLIGVARNVAIVFAVGLVKSNIVFIRSLLNIENASKSAAVNLRGVGTAAKKMGVQFLIITAIVELIKLFRTAFRDAAGDVRNFADQSAKGLERYSSLLDEVRGKAADLSPKSVNKSLLIDGTGIGNLLPKKIDDNSSIGAKVGFNIRRGLVGAERGIQKTLGLSTYEDKQRDDRLLAARELQGTGLQTLDAIQAQVSGRDKELSQLIEIDKRLENIQRKRRSVAITDPTNSTGQALSLKKEETALIQRRSEISKPVSALQAQNQFVIDSLKDTIVEYEKLAQEPGANQSQYRQELNILQANLKAAEKAQESFTRQIGKSVDAFTLLGKSITTIVNALSDLTDKQTILNNQANTFLDLGAANGDFTTGQVTATKASLEQSALAKQIEQNSAVLQQLSVLIDTSETRQLKQTLGINGDTGQATLTQLAGDTENEADKFRLETLAEIEGRKLQLSELQTQFGSVTANLSQQIRDVNKEVTSYFTQIQAESKDIALSVKEAKNSVALTSAKSKLKTALLGFQDNFVSEYVNSLVGFLDTLNQPLQESIQAQQQLLSTSQQLLQTQLQGQQLQKGLLQEVGVKYLTDSSGGGGVQGEFAYASPSAKQDFDQVLGGSVSPGQSLRAMRKRKRGVGLHNGIDFDRTEGLTSNDLVNIMFPGRVVSNRAWGDGYADQGGGMSNAVNIESALPNGQGNFFVKYGHIKESSIAVDSNQQVKAGQRLGKLSVNDAVSRGGHLDLKIAVPKEFAKAQGLQTGSSVGDNIYVEVKQFMRWYKSQVDSMPTQTSPTQTSPMQTSSLPSLGSGYESLEKLSGALSSDKRFDTSSPEGRARLALAVGIGGSEVYSKGSTQTDFFSRRGGTGNNMLGFGQFNLAYHSQKVNTPEKYVDFFGKILAGQERLPNSREGQDFGASLSKAVQEGSVANGQQLIAWMQSNQLGGSNWQGVDDGWSRVPGLADKLVTFLQSSPTSSSSSESVKYLTPPNNFQFEQNSATLSGATQLASDNAKQRAFVIQSQLAAVGKLSELEARIQQESNTRKLSVGFKEQQGAVLTAQRRVEDLGADIGVETPERARAKQELSVQRNFFDTNRDLLKQLDELRAVEGTTASAIEIIEEGNFFGADRLQSDLPVLRKGLADTESAIAEIEGLIGKADATRKTVIADINQKFEVEDAKRRQEAKDAVSRARIETNQSKLGIAEAQQSRNPLVTPAAGDPAVLKAQIAIDQIDLDLSAKIRELEELGRTGVRSEEEIAALRQEYQSFAEGEKKLAALQQMITFEERIESVKERMKEISDFTLQSDLSVLDARASLAEQTGRPIDAKNLRRESAELQQRESLDSQLEELDAFAERTGASAAEVAHLRNNIVGLNEIKLESIRQEFHPMRDIIDGTRNAFSTLFHDLADGSKSFGETIGDFFKSIGDSAVDMFAKFATNKLFGGGEGGGGGLLGGLFGGGESSGVGGSLGGGGGGLLGGLLGGGGGGGLLGGLFNFSEGGSVGGIPSPARHGNDDIGFALRREGSQSVLAALTIGEQVLNVREAKVYRSLFPRGIENFASGGQVGGGSPKMMLGSGTLQLTFNQQFVIGGNGGNSIGEEQGQQLAATIQNVVQRTIQEEKKQGRI